MLFLPTTGIRALVIGTRIFLVCSVVAALTDLPHQKRIFLEPYFFCQFLETIRRFQIQEGAMVADEGLCHDTTDRNSVSDMVWAFRVHSDAFRIDECASDIHGSHA